MIFEDLSSILADALRHRDGDVRPLPEVSKEAGETVIKAGETGGCMFVVQSGEAQILHEGVALDVVGPGGVVGEMALVDGSLRSATVVARTDLQLMPISKSDFELLIRRHPDFGIYVMKVMSLRLRLMNIRLGTAMDDISAREEMERELREMAILDPLTGVVNRQHFTDMAAQEIERARRHGRDLAVVMLDVDHFKSVNDTHGHACGDEALRTIVASVEPELRTTDVFARMGGEEFAILLPETSLEYAAAIGERIRASIAKQTLAWDGKDFGVTASIGVAAWAPGETVIEPALARADRALYAAKDGGRNRVVVEATASVATD